MERILRDLDRLITFNRLNRQALADSIGAKRQNMIAPLKAHRSMPSQHLGNLLQAVGIDEAYHFDVNQVHGLTVTKGEAHAEKLLTVLQAFMTEPVRQRWFLQGIGEGAATSKAIILEDARNALIAVRNDDGRLSIPESWKEGSDETRGLAKRYFDRDDLPKREAPLALYQRLFDPALEPVSVNDCRAMLAREAKVWTWTRVAEQAQKQGLDAIVAAEKLGLNAKMAAQKPGADRK